MKLNWDNIRNIFQIPRQWFLDIQTKIEHAYGTNFIRVDVEGREGGIEIGVIEETFTNMVREIASSSSGNIVSVDGRLPNASGQIDFGLQPTKWVKTDASGHLSYTDQEPISVDATRTGVLYNNRGTLSYYELTGVGSTKVAGDKHEHGNITSEGKMKNCFATGCFVITDENGIITHSDNQTTEHTGSGSDIMSFIKLVEAFEWNTDTATPLVNKGLVKTVDGQAPDGSGNVATLSVKQVNGVSPDNNGNVNLGAIVKTINHQVPDVSGNINVSGVKSVNNIEPDDSGNVDLGDVVMTVEGNAADINGNVVLTNVVKQVNGIAPINGNVTVPIVQLGTGHDQAAYGDHEHTHNDISDWDDVTSTFIDTLDVATRDVNTTTYEGEAYVCPTKHKHNKEDIEDLDTTKFVTTDTEQVIDAKKAFNGGISFENGDGITRLYNSPTGQAMIEAANSMNISSEALITISGALIRDRVPYAEVGDETSKEVPTCGWVSSYVKDQGWVTTDTQQTITSRKKFQSSSSDIEVDGTTIQMIQKGNQPPMMDFIGSYPNMNISIGSIYGVVGNEEQPALVLDGSSQLVLNAPPNMAQLYHAPTVKDATSNAIATVGFVMENSGRVKTVNNIEPDANGNVQLSTGEGTVKSVDNQSPDANGNIALGAVKTTDVETSGTTITPNVSYTRYVCPTQHSHNHNGISDWNTLVGDIAKYDGLTVGGFNATASGSTLNVDFNLQSNKFVKTDNNGKLTTTNDKVITVGESDNPISDNIDVVTGVEWKSPNIVIHQKRLTFKNGVLISTSSLADRNIGTTTYSGS